MVISRKRTLFVSIFLSSHGVSYSIAYFHCYYFRLSDLEKRHIFYISFPINRKILKRIEEPTVHQQRWPPRRMIHGPAHPLIFLFSRNLEGTGRRKQFVCHHCDIRLRKIYSLEHVQVNVGSISPFVLVFLKGNHDPLSVGTQDL